MTMKIALLGSAPSSVRLAPYDDPSWTIWSCSPGAYPHVRRANAWFEIHRWEKAPWFSNEYIDFMRQVPGPVYMINPVPEIPNSVAYPKDAVLSYVWGHVIGADGVSRPSRFNPNDFGSTLSWMLAMAIIARPKEIGLWGVDMAAGEEYGPQKDGCLSLIKIARDLGIVVTVPHESDLLRPQPLYGFREVDPMHIKLLCRKAEITQRIQAIVAEVQQKDAEHKCLIGALDNVEYMLKTWIADPTAIQLAYSNPDPFLEEISEPLPKPNGHHVEQSNGVQAQA